MTTIIIVIILLIVLAALAFWSFVRIVAWADRVDEPHDEDAP